MSFYSNVEQILSDHMVNKLKVLEIYSGVDLDIYNIVSDEYSKVYGNNAGKIEESANLRIKGMITGDDFTTSDSLYSGNFLEGFLFTSHTGNLTGKVIKIVATDSKSRRYKVETRESIGTTQDVFFRYKITNLAG